MIRSCVLMSSLYKDVIINLIDLHFKITTLINISFNVWKDRFINSVVPTSFLCTFKNLL